MVSIHVPPCAPQILTSRPRQEWLADVAARYRALSQFSKDDARVQVGISCWEVSCLGLSMC